MANIKTFQVNEGGEVRVGIYSEYNEVCVSLALNHFEDDEQWGAQPLTPKEAMEIGKALMEYAVRAETEQTNQKVKI